MTRFSPIKSRSPEEWSSLALKETNKSRIEINVIGGVVVSCLAYASAGVLPGILTGGYFLWDAWRQVSKSEKDEEAIYEYGCVAQLLSDKDFFDYLNQVGEKEVTEELDFASKRGLSISPTAKKWMCSFQKNLPEAKVNEVLEATSKTTTEVIETSSEVHEMKELDLIKEMTSTITNSLIIGAPRTGKGMLVSNALRAAKEKHSHLKIYVIDPKAEPGEKGYFDGVADWYRAFACDNESDSEILGWIQGCFDDYYEKSKDGNVLLFIDEIVALGSAIEREKSHLLQKKISNITSLQDVKGNNIWVATTSPFINGLGIKLSISSQMVPLILFSENNLGILKQWSRSSIMPKISLDNLVSLVQKSEVKRAIFFGKNGQWYPMRRLINYSEIDRDTPKIDTPAILQDKKEDDDEIQIAASHIYDWLKANRQFKWVRFKGKQSRDSGFIKFLSKSKISCENRDLAMVLLLEDGKIELSKDESEVRCKRE